MLSRIVGFFDNLIFYGINFLIVFIPFVPVSTIPFSLEMPWSLGVTIIIVTVLAALWLIKEIYLGTFTFARTPINLPIVAFVVLILFQQVPLPHWFLKFISPGTASVVSTIGNTNIDNISKILSENKISDDNQKVSLENTAHKKWHSISLYGYASRTELYRILAYIGVYFLIVNSITSKWQIRQLVITIIITATSIAFLGILQYLSQADKVFWLYDVKRTTFFGTITNRDHFACYMAMVIPLVLGLLITEYLQSKDKLQPAIKGHRVLFYVFAIIIMFSALFLARSGGGAYSIMTSLLLFIGMMMCRKRLKKLSWLILPLLFLVFGMLLWIGIQPVIEKLTTTIDPENPSLTARLDFWKDTISGIKDFPVFGVGIGVFPFIYPHYSTLAYTFRGFINHAHNEYLELMLETGIIGFCIILWALYRFIKDTAFYHILGKTHGVNHSHSLHKKDETSIHLKKRNDPFIIGVAMGGIIGIMSISLHNIVDFNFHVPASAFLLTVLLGITTSSVHMKHEALNQ